ncbi:MAG: undecaprenyldiphospho-muramoylpentapeptide beta-N-acetylglucosaminyltransferase [Deltaproteobacteria bacterium]|nr:undecaprenyldiphospho-muramoylpentapeptide beta-N-acetylglucosaminyltransferase [Deltaproteobacteria bacterium]
MMMKQKLLIAGGGTGGHIFPGIAVAEEWVKKGGEVVFVGTELGQEKKIVPQYGFKICFLKVGRLKGGGTLQKIKTLLGLPLALVKALLLILRERPRFALGIGGYASGPACVAARLLAKYTAITDQNVQPGITNRILGKIVHRVYLSFAESARFFAPAKVLHTGNPVRSQMETAEYILPGDTFCVLIFGGSQGAVSMNDGFIRAIERLPHAWPKLQICHQAGQTDLEKIETFYKERNINACVKTFFDNMNELYSKAHLVVCRSGAGTLTELAMCGRPAILVPYPFAADDHQKKNALVFVNHGAAWLVEHQDLSTPALANLLDRLMKEPHELKSKAEQAFKLARPDAAQLIVEDLLRREM